MTPASRTRAGSRSGGGRHLRALLRAGIVVAFAGIVLALAGCASPAASTAVSPVASGAARTPDVASFGIPATIGGWRLVATVKTMYPETAAIVAAAGGNPSTAVDVDVQVIGDEDRLNFDALHVPGVTLDAFTRAAEPNLAGAGLTERSVVEVAGSTVVRYATPAGSTGRSRAVFYARRGDVIYATGYMSDAQLATLLAGLP